MSEVTGTLSRPGILWCIETDVYLGRTGRAENIWTFRRRIAAVAFARRKGIRLEET